MSRIAAALLCTLVAGAGLAAEPIDRLATPVRITTTTKHPARCRGRGQYRESTFFIRRPTPVTMVR